jgi:ferredoxin
MTDRIFNMRLSCAYTGDENDIKQQQTELLKDGMWQPFHLGMQSAGFLIFVYAIFSCQHRMYRVKSAKQALLLDSARGSIHVTTDKDWKIKTLQVEFEGKLLTGKASQEDIEIISSAMKNCPVSANIREAKEGSCNISFV